MATVFRWLLRLTTGLIVLAVLAMLMVYYLGTRSLPDYDKTLHVNGTTSVH